MDVTVRIERLVLEGLEPAPGSAERLRAALEQALAERLTEALAAGGRVGRPGSDAALTTGPVTVTVTVPGPPGGALSPGAAAALGGHTGRALAAGLTGTGGAP
ncbi:hypothetical protein [Streptomyces sp. CB01881]|uniref:hypothetical protein n=1 Tax=Streptomyces sp. CB01881 TaxID=2078691 RepID=UPI000CDC7978|nr:hypothetical protein [Streptomyces sp. CB01881]AUY53146.1 hypothetical protein C2142_34280 [Streptomyces sp. CB01881]TYC69303.1 hypothetical protein EH183_34355 [Streptomyces sp. CB01881]